MDRESKRLNAEERHFAEEHHECITWFLRKYRLNPEDWYDIVAFGYLNAVREWHKKPSIRRWAFSTIAQMQMRKTVNKHWTYLNQKMRKGTLISLDHPVDGSKEITLYNLIPDPSNLEDLVESKLLLADMANRATQLDRKMMRCRLSGYNNVEIGKIVGVSDDTVRRHLMMLWKETYQEVAQQ